MHYVYLLECADDNSWYIGYSEGIMNYLNDATNSDDKAVTSLIRAGVQLSLF